MFLFLIFKSVIIEVPLPFRRGLKNGKSGFSDLACFL